MSLSLICPSCKGAEVDILASGLWDGEDKDGRPISGSCEYGICKQCHGRVARYDGPPYFPANEEWQSKIGPIEQRQRQMAAWPYEYEDPNKEA
jgi:ferredoxin